MPKNECLDCGASFDVTAQERHWRTYCNDCYKIRMTLKDQGLSKEEIDEVRKIGIVEKSPKTIRVSPGFDNSKLIESAQAEVEVIQPAEEEGEEDHIQTKEDFDSFIDKQGMEFKEVSVSLGEKVTVDYQSKNVQIGVVISLNGYSIETGYTTGLNFVRDRLEEQVKDIREEML